MKKLLIIGIVYAFFTGCGGTNRIANLQSDSLNMNDTIMKVDTVGHKFVASKKVIGTLNEVNLKSIQIFRNNDLTIIFSDFSIQTTFLHDRYDGRYIYNAAERGNIYITNNIIISAKIKDPKLPDIGLYIFDHNSLLSIGSFTYQFYKWENYGTYLGNNADFANDFAHTEKIKFSIGMEIEKANITGKTIYILAKNEGCLTKQENDFKEPKISYNDDDCSITDISSANELTMYTIVKIIKPNNIL